MRSLLLLLLILSLPVQAATDITGTKSIVKVKDGYSKTFMYGEPITNVYVHWDRPYHVYMTSLKTLHIGTAHKIKEVINSFDKLLNVTQDSSNRYVNIRIMDTSYTGKAPNIIILFENGKSLLINITILDIKFSERANQIVTFYDAEEEEGYTKEVFLQEQARLTSIIEDSKWINKTILFNPISRFVVHQDIIDEKNNINLQLENVTAIGKKLYFNIISDAKFKLPPMSEIVLEVHDLDGIFSTVNKDKIPQYPDSIITYPLQGNTQHHTLVFSLNHKKYAFFSSLKLGFLYEFETKVNFIDESLGSADIFETF